MNCKNTCTQNVADNTRGLADQLYIFLYSSLSSLTLHKQVNLKHSSSLPDFQVYQTGLPGAANGNRELAYRLVFASLFNIIS